jgi:hypothetical protein
VRYTTIQESLLTAGPSRKKRNLVGTGTSVRSPRMVASCNLYTYLSQSKSLSSLPTLKVLSHETETGCRWNGCVDLYSGEVSLGRFIIFMRASSIYNSNNSPRSGVVKYNWWRPHANPIMRVSKTTIRLNFSFACFPLHLSKWQLLSKSHMQISAKTCSFPAGIGHQL